jgi:hypothetical protein
MANGGNVVKHTRMRRWREGHVQQKEVLWAIYPRKAKPLHARKGCISHSFLRMGADTECHSHWLGCAGAQIEITPFIGVQIAAQF